MNARLSPPLFLRLFLLCLLLVGVCVIAAGCGPDNKPKKIALQIEPGVRHPASPPDSAIAAQADNGNTESLALPPPGPAESLARKTESYARSIQDALAKRDAAKASVGDGALVDSSDFHIGSTSSTSQTKVPSAAIPQQTAPPDKPAIQTSPTAANQVTAIAQAVKPNETANLPIAAPEPNANPASAVLLPSGDTFETRVTKRVRDYPRDVSANLDYQMLLFLRDEPVPQLSAISGMPAEDRELISAVMDGLSNFRSTLRSDNNLLLSRKIKPLTELSDRLRTQADLSIPTLALCTRVDGFGRYEPIDPPRFVAGMDKDAVIYCEMENFASQFNSDKKWQTDVTQEAVLYTEDGMQVWADKTQQVRDLSRNRRHDFFLGTLVKFPATLTVGRYLLKVTIVDKQANRVAESSMPIEVVAQ